MPAIFELRLTVNGQFMFHLRKPNGEVVLTSESYPTMETAVRGVNVARASSSTEARYERLFARDGSPFFHLKARSGVVICTSEMYPSEAARDRSIDACMRFGPIARLSDHTQH